MGYALIAFMLAAGLFIGILICFEVGRRIAIRRANVSLTGTGPIETAIFGLLGLLVAFTFYGAAGRLDARRELIVKEANDISTAYLRVDLLPADAQPEIREAFRNYVDSRLEFYKRLSDSGAEEKPVRSSALQKQIWDKSVSAAQAPEAHPNAGRLLLPALNSMIDITTTRTMALQMHPPTVVYGMLFGVALIGSVLAGRGMGRSLHWTYVLAFAGVMAISVYVILDLEYPRFGLIRVDPFDQLLADVRATMQ